MLPFYTFESVTFIVQRSVISCEAGKGKLAQDLANKLGVTVEACTTKVYIPSYPSPPLCDLGGEWIQFIPGKKP